MTETEFDKLLRSALMEAVWQDFSPAIGAAECEEIVFSEHYLKRREKMLLDPFAYAKKSTLTLLQRVARTAAMILLVCSLLFAVAMTVPEVRAAVKKLYTEWYETHIAVYVQDSKETGETDLSKFHVEIPPEVLPEGYKETNRAKNFGIVLYESETREAIVIDYRITGKIHEVKANSEGIIEQRYVIDGIEYCLLSATKGSKSNQVIWINGVYGLGFGLTAPETVDIDELLFLAQNISVTK